jgi:hypothetical protein
MPSLKKKRTTTKNWNKEQFSRKSRADAQKLQKD